jgi:hypothetical protein
MAMGLKGQGGLIMRILGRTLMILDGGFKVETVGHQDVFGSLETKGISCILMRCDGKRKGGFKRRGGIKREEIKRLVF